MTFDLQRPQKRGHSGSFAYRKHDIWHVRRKAGDPTIFQCTATSKRSGLRCRMSAMKGKGGKRTVCYWHGARGGNGNVQAPTNKRNLSNKEIQRARLYAAAEIERRRAAGELHNETAALFRDTDRTNLHPADEGRLWIFADDFLKNAGLNPVGAWREALRVLGLAPSRSTTTNAKATAPATDETLTAELTTLDWRKPALNDDSARARWTALSATRTDASLFRR